MVTQLDEERWHLWEMAKANLENAHKRYKDFVGENVATLTLGSRLRQGLAKG